ncbi:MAG: transglycosylase SLT domain-containing protein [Bacteroidales bacterium]|nr:transglycosylase SLT domain-containing protein [Bacteroidales bacterium]
MSRPFILSCAILTLLLAAGACTGNDPWHDGTPLRGAISMSGSEPGGPLLCGYHHELIGRFAKSSGRTAAIRLAGRKEAVLDSLRSGALDIVAFPYADSLAADTTLVVLPADSSGIWVFSAARAIEAQKASEWLEAFRESGSYGAVKQPFFQAHTPFESDSCTYISPYDSLLRVYADTLGWDWHLLAALVYQESKFRIEAHSSMGAVGLMQLIPDTAKAFGCTDCLDPEQNIRAAACLLLALEDRYRKIAAGGDELTKYTLAAYNAGSGRIRDCIRHARHMGKDVSRWENVASVIPQMRVDSIAAMGHIQHGTFNGRETIYFVRQVTSFSERYKKICP